MSLSLICKIVLIQYSINLFKSLGVGTAGLLFVLASRNLLELGLMLIIQNIRIQQLILVWSARAFLVSMRVDICMPHSYQLNFLNRVAIQNICKYCTNDDRRNDVNYFCEIASRAYNLYSSLVKSQYDK